jgi:hypothetical protein
MSAGEGKAKDRDGGEREEGRQTPCLDAFHVKARIDLELFPSLASDCIEHLDNLSVLTLLRD